MASDGPQVVLVSCYELGRQPLGLAVPLAQMAAAGLRTRAVDLAVEPLRPGDLGRPSLVALSTPMHTALRTGVAAARRLRRELPGTPIAFYGLYAGLNADHLLRTGLADHVVPGEEFAALTALARELSAGGREAAGGEVPAWGRPRRPPRTVPRRDGLPAPGRYARLEHDGRQVTAAAVSATTGCRHRCRHCPVTPVYDGRFFAVPREDVLADVAQLVAGGVGHITFADPDFLNGPTHARRLARALHARWPELTFDFTAKVEHLVRHAGLLPELVGHGALFAVTAVECLHDRALAILDKGHTRADVVRALAAAREAGLWLRPSLLPFMPWVGLGDYGDLLGWIAEEGLAAAVDPVQLSLRLLVPPGSPLAEHPEMRPHLEGLEPADFGWRWRHPDPRMDMLQATVHDLVREAAGAGEEPVETYRRITDAWRAAAGRDRHLPAFVPPARHRDGWPRLTEPWYC